MFSFYRKENLKGKHPEKYIKKNIGCWFIRYKLGNVWMHKKHTILEVNKYWKQIYRMKIMTCICSQVT